MSLINSLAFAANWQLGNLGGFAVNLLVTDVAQKPHSAIARRLRLEDNKTVSEAYPTLVTPAGYAFAIWGVIFGFETVFSIWQFGEAASESRILKDASPFWQTACWLQTVWALAFGRRYIGTAALLLSGIALSLNQYHSMISSSNPPPPFQLVSKLGFSIHFSWCVAAALVNWNLFLKQKEAPAKIREIFSIGSVFAAAAFGTGCALLRDDPIVSLVAGWALLAIRAKDKDQKHLDVSLTSIDIANHATLVLGLGCLVVSAWVLYVQQL